MKILLIIVGGVVGLFLVGIIALFVIGSVVGEKENKMSSDIAADAPIKEIPPPLVTPDPNGLQSPDFDTRQRAASRLGETANASDCDALLAALATEADWSVRAAIVTGLGKQYYQSNAVRTKGSDRMLGPIIKDLKADKPGLRIAALRALGAIRDKRAGRFVAPLLKDKDSSVREAAISTAGAIQMREAVPELITLISTPDDGSVEQKWPRIRATTALANIGDPRAVEPLMAALDDKDITFSSAAVTALGRLGDKRAAAPLRALLTNPSGELRFDAVCAVARLRDRESLPALQQIVHTDKATVNGQHMNDVAKRAIRFIESGQGKVNQYE